MAETKSFSSRHVYNGVHFTAAFPAEQIKKATELKFFEDDVLIATYPKAGLSHHCFLGHPQYIVWSTRSSDELKSCPTREKNGHFTFFFISSDRVLFFFFSFDEGKKPLSGFVDQTIYCGCPYHGKKTFFSLKSLKVGGGGWRVLPYVSQITEDNFCVAFVKI